MGASEPQGLRIHAAAPPMVAAEVSTGAEDVAADAWTQRWRRNEISFLGNRVEELERTLQRRTVLLGSATALCLAVALAFAAVALAEIALAAHLRTVVALLGSALQGLP